MAHGGTIWQCLRRHASMPPHFAVGPGLNPGTLIGELRSHMPVSAEKKKIFLSSFKKWHMEKRNP